MRFRNWLLCIGALGVTFVAEGANANGKPSSRHLHRAREECQLHPKGLRNKRYLTLIDYTLPVFKTRLWVIDRATGATVLRAHVAHAFRSGVLRPTRFSNREGSHLSCAGSFITGEVYQGRFGQALRVTGVDANNDRARARAIVFHSTYAPYTWGCFATLPATNKRLISLIKDGSLVYVAQ